MALAANIDNPRPGANNTRLFGPGVLTQRGPDLELPTDY